MKKLILVLAVVLIAAPVMAQQWSFYGSQRIGTWYVDRDYGDFRVNGQNDDQATQMFFQGNSRLGARVKTDKVSGHIEFGLGAGGDGGDTSVTTRRAYGVWNFADNASLKVGKDYSPVTDFISSQWFASDNDLLGEGNFYGRRPAGLFLTLGNFELAALVPSYGADVGTTATGVNNLTTGDPDSYIPRFEAAYTMKFGAGYLKPFGGFQYYKVEEIGTAGLTDDLDIWSWVLGLSTNWNIGAFSIGGQVSYGMNQGAVTGWSTGSNARSASSPTLKGTDDTDASYTLQAMLVAALKFTDTLRFEAGVGYRSDDPDVSGAKKDEVWAFYVQAMITLAKGVFLCPEIGYYDYMDDTAGRDQGNLWYAGAKWQIDF